MFDGVRCVCGGGGGGGPLSGRLTGVKRDLSFVCARRP